jgi:uncharacterized protein
MTGNKPVATVDTTTAGSAQAVAVPETRPMLEPGELEEFLLTCRPTVPVLSVDGLDGYLTALLIGPKFIDPRLWLGRLFGEQALLAKADTRDHLAIQAVVAHYNRLSVTLSDCPDQYRPMFKPHRNGGVDTLFWWLGFTAGIELDRRNWKRVTDSRQPGRVLFEPIYDAASHSGPSPANAIEVVASAVLEIRSHFLQRRHRSMR